MTLRPIPEHPKKWRAPTRCLGVAIGLFILLLASAAGEPTEHVRAQDEESPCAIDASTQLSQRMLLLGERVEVEQSFGVDCPDEAAPQHVVLVLDGSSAMRNGPDQHLKDAARDFVDLLRLRDHPELRVGIVSFNQRSITHCQLTNSASRLYGCIDRVGATGPTSISAGILAGIKVMNLGRQGLADPAIVSETMIVVAGGPDKSTCAPVQRAAGQASGQGILVVTVGAGPDADADCLRSVASSPELFWDALDIDLLSSALDRARQRTVGFALRQMTVAIDLPDDMKLVPGSAQPEPSPYGTTDDTLIWRAAALPSSGLTIRYELQPLEPGTSPVNEPSSSVTFRDTHRRQGRSGVPERRVTRLVPRLLP